MREGDDLFFAPAVRFSELELTGSKFPEQYKARIQGYYLDPVRLCVESGHAFGAGLLLVSAIDFMAGLHHSADELQDRQVGLDFRSFARRHLKSFSTPGLAFMLYDHFRNGLAHEARVKNGGEFSFQHERTVCVLYGSISINPAHLLIEVTNALAAQINGMSTDAWQQKHAIDRVREQFKTELGIVERARRAG